MEKIFQLPSKIKKPLGTLAVPLSQGLAALRLLALTPDGFLHRTFFNCEHVPKPFNPLPTAVCHLYSVSLTAV
jgi:hypothetical protein